MITRGYALTLAVGLLIIAALVVVRFSYAAGEPAAVAAIRAEFGTGPVAGCMVAIAWRESRYNPRAANWTDRHSDGSRGSFGALQIGALWRRPGETVAAFARRMFDPRQNARLAKRIFDRYGTSPWGGGCG